MKQTDPQFKLRFPPELKAKIEAAADANGRSMNAEIVSRLQDSFASHEQDVEPSDPEALNKIAAALSLPAGPGTVGQRLADALLAVAEALEAQDRVRRVTIEK